MFNKRESYLLSYLDDSILKLENSNGEEIFKCEIYKEDYEPVDYNQVEYLLKKTMANIDIKSNIIIRISSTNNIFRFEKAKGLKEADLENYYYYNIDKILPFSKEKFLLKYDYWRENFLVLGINSDLVNIISNKLISLGYKNIFVTTFPSEVLSHLENNNISDALVIKLEENSLELMKILREDIIFYKYKNINLNALDQEISYLSKTISIDTQLKALVFGDKKIVNKHKDKLDKIFGREFSFEIFDIEKYFGE